MNIYIGENIKRLRRERGITQEELAERMNISAPAVSKWERGETLPDITMVLPLASYFGVTTDELLGFDETKNEERIQWYIDEGHRLSAIGKLKEAFGVICQAYSEFPNDFRIIEEYMWKLNYDPNCKEPYGNEVHKDELYRLCNRVLDECTLDSPRYSALSILSGLYVLDGQMEKAVEVCKRFPDHWSAQGQQLEYLYKRGSEEWWKQFRKNIAELTQIFHIKLSNAAFYSKEGSIEDAREKIRLYEKAEAIIKLIYDDGDYGFCHYNLADLYFWLAGCYAVMGDYDKVLEYFEKTLYHSKQFDELPKITYHTSYLVKGNERDMSKISAGSEENCVWHNLHFIRESGVYPKLKDLPQMQEIIAKYEPFAGKRKDYSK